MYSSLAVGYSNFAVFCRIVLQKETFLGYDVHSYRLVESYSDFLRCSIENLSQAFTKPVLSCRLDGISHGLDQKKVSHSSKQRLTISILKVLYHLVPAFPSLALCHPSGETVRHMRSGVR